VPEIYYPMTQSVSQRVETGMTLVAQTRVPPESTINEIRGLIQRQFPEAAVFDVMTMDAVVGNSLADVRLYTWLIATFAALATLLACAGIFGVVSYSVATRRRDYGIRLALGAAPSRLVASVFGYGATLVGAGLLAGAGGALAVHRLVDRLLLPVEGLGAWPLLATALVLAAAAQLACAVPAWRVSRLDPMTTLRTE
jgi:ABC-type antimicrobial peptide transport system permease subunit